MIETRIMGKRQMGKGTRRARLLPGRFYFTKRDPLTYTDMQREAQACFAKALALREAGDYVAAELALGRAQRFVDGQL